MNSRIDSIISKSQALLSTMLAILAISIAVILFLEDRGNRLTGLGWIFLFILFYSPIVYAIFEASRLVHARRYPEIAAFKDPDFALLMNSESEVAAIHLANETRNVLDSLEGCTERDLAVHERSVVAFEISQIGAIIFILLSAFELLG